MAPAPPKAVPALVEARDHQKFFVEREMTTVMPEWDEV
jgi:hypothetical protein